MARLSQFRGEPGQDDEIPQPSRSVHFDVDTTATVPTWRPEVESRERDVRAARRRRSLKKEKRMTITTRMRAEVARQAETPKLDAEALANKLVERFMDDVLAAVEDVSEDEKCAYIKDALMQLDGALAARLRPYLVKR